MGIKLVLPGVRGFTGPKVYADPIMSAGSLLLWDPTHPLGGDAAGTDNGAPLANIAADVAAGILSIAPSAARPTLLNASGGTNPAASIKERSARGGLCSIYSKAQTITTLSGATQFGLVAAFLKNYLFTHRKTRSFFASVWVRPLRSGRAGTSGTSAQPVLQMAAASASTANYLFMLNGYILGGLPNSLGHRAPNLDSYNARWDTPDALLLNQGRAGTVGWDTGTVETSRELNVFFGNGEAWVDYNEPGPSGIIERVYIEDLTTSGRTYAEVDEIDLDLFTKAHAAGGAWHGDTYTNPATFP